MIEELTGIEQLLAMAAADGRFAAALLEQRSRAVEASGVVLSPIQQRVLSSIDEDSLRGMILGLAGTRPEQDRRLFIGRSAAALAALAGGVVLISQGGCTKNREAGKAGPEEAPREPSADPEPPPPAPAPDSRAAVQPEPPSLPRKFPGETTGIRPDHVKALGSGGYTGSRPGRNLGRLGAWSPVRVTADTPSVKGGLNPEILRRINRRHANEVKYCYQKELQKKPGLAGAIEVSYTIDARGMVSASSLVSSTMSSPAVERCVVQAVRRWLYPKPGDGKPAQVSVTWTMWVEKKKKKGGKKG